MIAADIDPTLISAIVAGVLGSGFIGAVFSYRKTGAETESVSVNTLRGVVEELRTEVTRKDKIIESQAVQITDLITRVATLEKQLREVVSLSNERR